MLFRIMLKRESAVIINIVYVFYRVTGIGYHPKFNNTSKEGH